MHYSGLGIARSLGPHGIPVYGLSSSASFPGNYSRYCSFQPAPDSLEEPAALRDFLMNFAASFDGRPILLPTRDHDIEFLLGYRANLEHRYTIPLADNDIIEQAMNKDRCLAIAAEHGIAVPRSHTVRSLDEFSAIAGSLSFPVIVKPLYAHQWRRPGIWQTVGHQKAALIDDATELADFYRAIVATAPLATIQEFIPGPDSNLLVFGSYCRPGGDVRAYFTGRKLLQDPPLKGTGLIVEGLPVPEIVGPSRALLKALNFFGISEIEFKRHERTGVDYLIEINPRHWDQHYLGTVCGVNLSLEQYLDLTEPGRLQNPEHGAPAPGQLPGPIRWIAEQDLLFYALRRLRAQPAGLWRELKLARRPRTFSVRDTVDPAPGRKQQQNIYREMKRLVLPPRR
jgi:predicted ATP-grasp superfamily ATP-dependent carboligase